MKRLYPLVAVILGGCCVAAFAADAPRPNIVLFLADDLGWADVPWHGSSYKLPHLDRLAAEGVRLESHYVHPMCSPTRAALMTGRYASRFGVTAAQNHRALPFDTVTLASASSGRLPDGDHRQMASRLCARMGTAAIRLRPRLRFAGRRLRTRTITATRPANSPARGIATAC